MRFFGGLGLGRAGGQRPDLRVAVVALVGRATQKRPVFWSAGGLAIAGLLLFLIGFLAELIVNQGERLAELERLARAERRDGLESEPGVEAREHRAPL